MEYAFILLFLYASYLSIEKYVHTGSVLKWRGGQRPASGLPVKEEPAEAREEAVIGRSQYPDGLRSCAVHGLVIVGGKGEDLRQADLEADGHVRVLGEDAPVLDSEKGELTFQGGRFEYVSHIFFV